MTAKPLAFDSLLESETELVTYRRIVVHKLESVPNRKCFKRDNSLPSAPSAAVSLLLSITIFALMQIFKADIASKEYFTVAGGFAGSILFITLLTFTSNVETLLFGKGFQTKLFPEVILCLFGAMFASALVHRVCVTTCLIFSLLALYYINRISQNVYAPPVTVATAAPTKKRK